MKKKSWRTKIIRACKEVGTYRPAFDPVIEILAETMEHRDEVAEIYAKSGAAPILTHVNKAGKANPAKNPMIVLWDELNTSALAYWRDLGLTPSGLRRLTADAGMGRPASALDQALFELENECVTTGRSQTNTRRPS